MKTKQIIIGVAILFLGILIGKLTFNNTETSKNKKQKETISQRWTCSMHPQINMPEFGACPICGMDLIPNASNDEGLSSKAFKMTKNAIALANIETVIVGENHTNTSKETQNTLKLSGKIQTNDKATSVQTAHFGGRLEHLAYKSIGEYVNKGSLIATVYSPELVTAQNEFIETLAIKKTQPELYKAVRNKLRNWKISENQIQQIEQNKKVITNFRMYANVSGYIDEILVQEGSHVNEGMPLFKVTNLASVWAVFDVYENDIRKLKIGQHIKIKLNAYPDKVIKAKINFIDPILNSTTRTIAIRATLNNKNKKLKPGMLLTSEVELSKVKPNTSNKVISSLSRQQADEVVSSLSRQQADEVVSSEVEIPKTAIMWTGKRSIVYIKPNKNESIFELREVTLGNDNGTNYTIISGLKKGDEVVVNGTFTVDAAAQLQGKRSMMNNIKSPETKKKGQEEKQIAKRIEINSKFKKQLDIIFNDYLKIKKAFVLTEANKVNEAAKQTIPNLKQVKMKLLKKPEAHKIWKEALPIIKASLEALSTEKNIEKQRIIFIDLSNIMIELANSFGTEKTIYVQHCPMANDDKGADWLSTEKAIKNPYFGDKMLQCGTVEQIIE